MVATIYRRKLPHVRSDGAVYFVTWRLAIGQPDLSAAERDCVARAVKHFDPIRYLVHAYVVMNDHVHVLVGPEPVWPLETIVQSWKSFTANRLQRDSGRRRGAVWQQEYFDRVIRDDEEYDQKRDYILNNPAKRWPDIDGYRWAWAIGMDMDIA